ncbi:MAG: ATP-binding protein [Thermoguttaceae bacterium]
MKREEQDRGSAQGQTPPGPLDRLPEWYPAWARELAELYFSGTTCVFVLHGNVHDLFRCPAKEGGQAYCNLSEFLTTQVFGTWDIVLGHDLSRGLKPQAGSDAARLGKMMQTLTARWGEPASWPPEPDRVLTVLDHLIERSLVDPPADRKSMAVIFEYAQYLVPEGGLDSLARGYASRVVRMLRWAQNPHIKRVNMAFCLVADRLAEVSDRLVQSSHVAVIEIPFPEREERRAFCEWAARDEDLSKLTEFSLDELADVSNGLTLVNLNVLLAQAAGTERRVDGGRFRELKKGIIERECQGLIEFIEPKHHLDMVVGHGVAKKRLEEDALWISRGQFDTAPMGYLICGPVGTGKTFLAECYAGSIGIPCAVLKNFRSKYVGETEGNLQKVLSVLRWLGPVVVVIDEADAALGTRQAEGDSGTSARVFSMIARQMGDTHYRGKIIWMLLTSRPELLPIDLKRQGRAEVHIPLFYPVEEDELRSMFEVMARKNKLVLAAGTVPPVSPERRLTGADIESILLGAMRHARAEERSELTTADLEYAVGEFIPSSQGLEKERQEIAAVLECTQMSFLPPHWREKVAGPEGRARLQERMTAIRQILEE